MVEEIWIERETIPKRTASFELEDNLKLRMDRFGDWSNSSIAIELFSEGASSAGSQQRKRKSVVLDCSEF
jgi:hypothetical protein